MTEGLVAVQSRIDQLRTLVGGSASPTSGTALGSSRVSASGTDTGSGADFAASIAGLLGTGATDPAGESTGTSGSSGSAALGASAVALAGSYLGVPYRWGGTDPKSGLDCSGLVQLVFRQLGVDLPRTSQQQQHSGTEVAALDRARAGDLVFFGEPAHHVGIYVGDGKMIDAPHSGSVVGVHPLYGTPSHIRRVTGAAGGSAGVLQARSLSTAGLSGSGLSTSGLSTSGLSTSGLSGPYADLFTAAGNRNGVDPALLSAVAKAESGYRPRAVSAAGAQGLMQLMPGTARSLGVDALQPEQAVDGAARLLSGYLKTYSGRVDLAVAAYNAGPGAVNRYGGVPPYSETRTYVQRVTSYWKALK